MNNDYYLLHGSLCIIIEELQFDMVKIKDSKHGIQTIEKYHLKKIYADDDLKTIFQNKVYFETVEKVKAHIIKKFNNKYGPKLNFYFKYNAFMIDFQLNGNDHGSRFTIDYSRYQNNKYYKQSMDEYLHRLSNLCLMM